MHILDYRKALENCAAFSPLVSKKNHPSPHPVQNWNTNVQEVTCSPSAPQWKSLAFLIWVSQVAELTLPLQNQVPALLSRENNLHFINWELRKLKKNLTGCAKIAKYNPTGVKTVENMQVAIYCSCPQDSDAAKVILLVCSNRTDESVSSLWCIICPLMSTLWGGRQFSTHSARGCAQFGLCAGSKGAFTVGKDMAQGCLRRYRSYSSQKRVFQWVSVNSSSTRTLAGQHSQCLSPAIPLTPCFHSLHYWYKCSS